MNNSKFEAIVNGNEKIAVIGLGYVGLPIALDFARKVKVVGFDINEDRVKMMQRNEDPSKELDSSEFEGCDITFTANPDDLAEVTFFIVAVPTPIDESNMPNLGPLLGASKTVGKVLKKGDYVVYESTVYPGCTEEDCIPILEKESGLTFKSDFKVGYSPERINPGDKVHTLQSVIKVVAGSDEESLENIAKVYELVVTAGVHRAPTMKVAEAAKIIENTQRDVNISLINELSIIFDKLDINTYDVLDAAATKWNFLKFTPGLVGGHCIGVDPYYLTHKAKQAGYHAKVINSGRYVNDSMGFYIGKQCVKKMIAQGKNMNEAKVLVMGATFKENVSDIRNSKVIDVVNELKSFAVDVHVIDPHASSEELHHEYGIRLTDQVDDDYDAVIVAVNHDEYTNWKEVEFKKYFKNGYGVFVDVKGIYKNQIDELEYWSL
ncbi:MAG: nucleotide sugar dehydrogenase [Bacteroidota bacterium]